MMYPLSSYTPRVTRARSLCLPDTRALSSSLAVLMLLLCSALPSGAEDRSAPQELVNADGTYKTVPLEKDTVTLTLIQSAADRIKDVKDAPKILKKNAEHMVEMGRRACKAEKKPDILLFHEFPLTGYFFGKRPQKLEVAINIPGPETALLSALASECDAYLVFGAYAKDAEWPGHVLSINTVIGRKGQIIKKVWKPKNIKRFYDTFEISTTTVESVQRAFRAKYGVDDEFPVIRTEFGNLAVTTVQLDPMIFAAFAMKGTEIMLRTSTLFFRSDVISTAMVNDVYSAMANIPMKSKYAGHSIIVDPNGKVLAEVDSHEGEGIISAEIPIAEFRRRRRLPQYPVGFTRSVFSQYQDEIPPDHMELPADQLPVDGKAMKVLIDAKSRWRARPPKK